jgi:hypothetical protein
MNTCSVHGGAPEVKIFATLRRMSRPPLTVADAEEELEGLPLVPAVAGKLDEIKQLRARCLAAGIPVLMGCPPGAGKG